MLSQSKSLTTKNVNTHPVLFHDLCGSNMNPNELSKDKRISFLSIFSSLTQGGILPNDAESTAYQMVNKLFATYIVEPASPQTMQPQVKTMQKKQWVSGTCDTQTSADCQARDGKFNSQGKFTTCYPCKQSQPNQIPF